MSFMYNRTEPTQEIRRRSDGNLEYVMNDDATPNDWDTEENGQEREDTPPNPFGSDIDFRIESNDNSTILNFSRNDNEYICDEHGTVTEVIKFDFDGNEEVYCIRCWRDQFRNNQTPLAQLRR